jgi:dipeptidyl-peptidase-4
MKYAPLLALMAQLSVAAQTTQFDKTDLMKGRAPVDFFDALPSTTWVDGHSLQINSKGENSILNLKTAKSRPAQPITRSPSAGILRLKDNDLFLTTPNGEIRLTDDPEAEQNPTFSPDSTYIAYTKGNNLYTYHVKEKREKKITTDGNQTILNGYATWIYWEEIYGRSTTFRAFWWSPDSRRIAYMRFDETNTPMFPLYSSMGQHGHLEETRYPKAGDPNPTAKLGFVSPDGGKTLWADFNEKEDQYFGWPKWLSDGSGLIVQWVNRGNDHLKIFNVSPTNGAKKQIYEEQQSTWISIDEAEERLHLLESSKEMLVLSDKSGWKQLYLHNLDGTFKNKVTDGKLTITEVYGVDAKTRTVYFQARGIENSARFDLYRVGLDGKNLKRLSFGAFSHRSIIPSPDLSYFVTTYSNLTTPNRTAVIDQNGKVVRELGDMKGKAFQNYSPARTELIRVKSDDGRYDLPLVITYPSNYTPGTRYPVLLSIYGGPNAGTVFDQWSWTPARQWLAEEGMVQVAFDHRASGHFGKEGANFLHRNLGEWELRDYSTMARYLINEGIADPERIGITGFSYGGYMSCLALTKGSDVFTHGMAGGSVTDWKYYDTAYTERFMDTPQENPEGYRAASVLTYVNDYKGNLLITHGTMDDNVHMQNSLQLVSDLQNAKKDFEFMLYPEERHGYRGEKGVHFQRLKNKFIYQHLLRKPMPDVL